MNVSTDMSDQTPTLPVKRAAIVGTHPTYKATPWKDQSVEIFSLNDAYVLPGFARANGWCDLHPIPELVFRPKGERKVAPEHAPVGGYLRPEGHIEWLKTRGFPVYLHDCREGHCVNNPKRGHDTYPFPKWSNAQPFPFKAIEAAYGPYWSSTPAWMLAWLLMGGYRDIHITGIALCTEWEYIQQRPNMEFLIGMALAQGVTFTIPERSSLLKSKHKYAVEPKPGLEIERVERRLHRIKTEGARLQQRLASLKWHQRSEAADLTARLAILELEVTDCRQESHGCRRWRGSRKEPRWIRNNFGDRLRRTRACNNSPPRGSAGAFLGTCQRLNFGNWG